MKNVTFKGTIPFSVPGARLELQGTKLTFSAFFGRPKSFDLDNLAKVDAIPLWSGIGAWLQLFDRTGARFDIPMRGWRNEPSLYRIVWDAAQKNHAELTDAARAAFTKALKT